jgi:hypothetical protein
VLATESLATIRRDRLRGQFVYPDYGRYSLAEVGPTLLDVFGVASERPTLPAHVYRDAAAGCDRVVLFVLDGFGYVQLVRHHERLPFFQRLVERGAVHALTSVFPSTTAAGLTTLHTGLAPAEHGLPEWTMYFEEVDSLIETLPFRRLGDPVPDGLLREGADPGMLYAGPTVYSRLAEAGVPSYCFAHEAYATSVYSSAVMRGAQVVPYGHGSDLVVRLRQMLATVRGPAYFHVYWSAVDAVAHRFGPHSEEHRAELSVISHLLQTELLDQLPAVATAGTLLLLTADHGQVPVDPEAVTYLDHYPELVEALTHGRNGARIPPGGSPRDVFLHLAPERRDACVSWLRELLAGKAEVLAGDEAPGLYGRNGLVESLARRVGNALIVPYQGHEVWYRHLADRPFTFRGHHGGLAEAEMLVPLAIAPLASL